MEVRAALRPLGLLLVLGSLLGRASGGEGPDVEAQPVPCTIPEKPLSLCARVTSDGQITAARIYFRHEGAEFFSFVNMTFGGINYCGTLPAPKERTKSIDYYIEAVDDNYESKRLSTFQIAVKPEGACDFPPVEKDPTKAASITVHATNKKQGRKLDEAFEPTGVSFIPIAGK
jgi:hypothetical protein